jgi:hypothetical protein
MFRRMICMLFWLRHMMSGLLSLVVFLSEVLNG